MLSNFKFSLKTLLIPFWKYSLFEVFNWGLNTRYVLFNIPFVKVVGSGSFNVFSSKLEILLKDKEFNIGNGFTYNLNHYRMLTEMLQTTLNSAIDLDFNLVGLLRGLAGLGVSLGTGGSFQTSTELDGNVTYDTSYLVNNSSGIDSSDIDGLGLGSSDLVFPLAKDKKEKVDNPLWGDMNLRLGLDLLFFSFRYNYSIFAQSYSVFLGMAFAI